MRGNCVSYQKSLLTYLLFYFRAKTKDVKVLCQRVPRMILVGKSIGVSVSKFGKCQIVQEQKSLVHPRLAFFRMEYLANNKTGNDETESVDQDILPAPTLNRFRNSTMFWTNPTIPQLEFEKYFSRTIIRDPNYQVKHSYVHTFGGQKSNLGIEDKRRNRNLSLQVDQLQKSLKTKDEEMESKDKEIELLKARLEEIEKRR